MNKKKRVLVALLDWGLGHATRCIPLINEFVAQGAEVIIAADGRSLALLESEFKNLKKIRLKGYHPKYPTGRMMVLKMALQTPKFLKAIYDEHKTINKWIGSEKIDLVFSDNRFGMWTKKVPCVLMNHQLHVLMPGWFKFMEPGVNWLTRYFTKQFNQCWVPDFPGHDNLTGKLTSAFQNDDHYRFIGPLSRIRENGTGRFDHKILVLLSGPEPQRSLLEKMVVGQLKDFPAKTLVVSGIPGKQEQVCVSENLCIESCLESEEVAMAMTQAEVIISRSGYSTIMDLAALGKKAIVVPTPGQTEQEYLAERLRKRKCVLVQKQNELNLKEALLRIDEVDTFQKVQSDGLYKKAISDLLKGKWD